MNNEEQLNGQNSPKVFVGDSSAAWLKTRWYFYIIGGVILFGFGLIDVDIIFIILGISITIVGIVVRKKQQIMPKLVSTGGSNDPSQVIVDQAGIAAPSISGSQENVNVANLSMQEQPFQSQSAPQMTTRKKGLRWLLWLGVSLVAIFLILMAIGSNLESKQPGASGDINKYFDNEDTAVNLEKFAKKSIVKCQSGDISGIKQSLISDYSKIYPDTNIDEYFGKLCENIKPGKIDKAPNTTIGSKNGFTQMIYRKKMTINSDPYILIVVVVEKSDKIQLYDISYEPDKNPEEWVGI